MARRRRAAATPIEGIPDRAYFRIGEVARLCAVKPHVLRHWESAFASVRPEKAKSGQRVYTRAHVERLLRIRHLLYDQRFTIAGARARLRELGHAEAAPPPVPPPAADHEALRRIKQAVGQLIKLVDD